jgi:hypothetical protein
MKRSVIFIALATLALLVLAGAGLFLFIQASGGNLQSASVADTSGQAQAPAVAIETAAGSSSGTTDASGANAGTANGEPTAGLNLTPQTDPASPAKANSKLQSSISELAATQSAGGDDAANDFAAAHGLELKDGKVKVVLETAPMAASATQTPESAASQTAVAAGAVIETTYDGLVQAQVPVENLPQLASSAAISYVREPHKPTTFVTSEGVADIGANTWQSGGLTGAGVKIAVLDPGFSGYQSLVASGELPANVITQSFVTGGDITTGGVHGAACAEIVRDVAPGAQLYLVNFSTDVELGNAVDYLIAQGVNVVSASWGFYGSFRGDGQGSVDDMVQQANAAGIFWANASGNAAQAHWSGHFTDANSDTWHEFSSGDPGNSLTASAGSEIDLYLTWDKWPLTDQDYDMYLVWSGNPSTAVAAGDSWQNGSTPPSEEIHYIVPMGRGGTYRVLINKYSATGDANFQLYSYPDSFQYQVAAGSLGGQPTDSAYAMTVGAVPVGTTTIENFSSQGPTIDGRIKPDIVAPDRVSTVTYGSQGFWGTSAATPHAAGAAALVKAGNPGYTPAAIQAMLESRATGLGAPGKDNVFGSGKLNLGALPDNTPPVVTGVEPSGTVNQSNTTIVVHYYDIGSGINTSSVNVTLDGAALAGCTINTAQASCPVSGLASGTHTIGGAVADNSGNSSPISGSFTVVCGRPQLSVGSPSAFWSSYADYVQGELSVTFTFSNNGIDNAYNVALVGSINTNSAQLASTVPVPIGDIAAAGGPGSSVPVTVKYAIPAGVNTFRSTVYLTAYDVCGVVHAYPSVFSGP